MGGGVAHTLDLLVPEAISKKLEPMLSGKLIASYLELRSEMIL